MLIRSLSMVLTLLWPPAAFAIDVTEAAKEFSERYRAPSVVRALGGWQGNDSAVTEPSVARITDDKAWAALWARHDPSGQPPKVDFRNAMVIAVFLGTVSSLFSGIHLDSVLDSSELEITSGVFIGDVITRETFRPYLFVVLPRSTKAIIVVEHSFGLMMQPQHNYRVVGRLEPQR
jgi:hypothetical protein